MAFVGLLFPLLIIGLVAGIFVFAHRQHEERKKNWAAVAQNLGLFFDGESISGRLHGHAVRCAIVVRGSGKNRTSYTVVSSHLEAPLDVGLLVREHGFVIDLFNSSPDVQLGDPAFDAKYLINGDEDWRVRGMLSLPLRQLMMRCPELRVSDNGAAFDVQGVRRDAAWTHSALDAVAQAAVLLEEGRKQVPSATPLGPHRHAWETFARAQGMQGMATPLCMWGKIGGAQVYAYSARTGRLTYQLDVSVRFPQPLNIGLSVRAPSFIDQVGAFFGGSDLQLGDRPFDDAFEIQARDPMRARELLGPELRRELMAIQYALGPVRLDDLGLTVRLPFVPHDPSTVPRTVHQLAGLAERVGGAGAAIAQGAYR